MFCTKGFGIEGITNIFLPLRLEVLTAGPGAVNVVGAAEYLATVSSTDCETALDGDSEADAEAEVAAGVDAAALLELLLELPLEHAASARAPAAIRTAGPSRRVENI